MMDDDLFKQLEAIDFGDGVDTAPTQATTDALTGLATQMETAATERKAALGSMGAVLQDITRQQEQRLAETTPPMTQQELERRRNAGTLVATITGALSNLANGIAVSRGALNATVPDGYTLAYQHWNDIEKRNAARKQEYDKLLDSIYSSRLNEAKMKYGEADDRFKALEKQYYTLLDRREKRENDFARLVYGEAMRNQRNAEDNAAKITTQAMKGKGGGSRSTSTPANLDGYRTITRSADVGGNVTIPSGVQVEQAYATIAEAGIRYYEEQLREIDNDADLTPSQKTAKKKDVNKKIDALTNNKNISGSNAKTRINNINGALGDVPSNVIQGAVNALQSAPAATAQQTAGNQQHTTIDDDFN